MFWKNVAALLSSRGAKDIWLIKEADLSSSTYYDRKKSGEYPRVDEAYRISETLDVSIKYLLFGEEEDIYANLDPLSRQICEAVQELSEKNRGKILANTLNMLDKQKNDDLEKETKKSNTA